MHTTECPDFTFKNKRPDFPGGPVDKKPHLPGHSVVKNPPANAGDSSSIPGWGRSPGGRHGNSFEYSCWEKPHGQCSLVGYSSWAGKESDATEHTQPVQGIQFSLVWEDLTCCRASMSLHHNYYQACALEPSSSNYWSKSLEPMLCNKRNHHDEKLEHRNKEWPVLAAARESLCAATKTQRSQK